MKQLRKNIIKNMVLFLIIFFCFDSFSNKVLNDDKSSFMTKSEFEALKNTYQLQFDKINAFFDSKIDDAVSSYLAGINLNKTKEKPIIPNAWGEYTIMNGRISNEFAYPDINANTTWLANNVNDNYRKIWFGYGEIKYTGTHASNRRVLLTNITPASTLYLNNATWAGIATNAREQWICTKVFRNDNLSAYGGVDANNRYMWCFQPLNITANGYYADLNTVDSIWNLKWEYEARGYAWRYYANYPVSAFSNAAIISYDANASGDRIIYEHLGNWKYDTSWECTIKDCNNYFKTSSNNALRTDGWLSVVTTGGGWSAMDAPRAGGNEDWQNNRTINWDDRLAGNGPTTNKAAIPTMGLIPSNLAANQIWQYDNLYDSDGARVEKLKLQQGIPAMKVLEGDTVEWEAVFSDVKVNGVSSNAEVVLMFAYEPFTDTSYISDENNYVKIEGFEKGTFPLTTDKKVKIKFVSEKEGYIYIKWFPNVGSMTTVDSTNWEVTMDFTKCPTYKTTAKEE